MRQYLDMMRHIRDNGIRKSDRTGTGTLSVFGYQMRCNLQEGFPLLTTKKVFTKGIIHELLWILKGETNIKYLVDNGVHIWDEWADADGNLGPVYGQQWRSWPGSVSQGYVVGGDGMAGDSWTNLAFDSYGIAEVDQDKAIKRGTIDQIANVIHSLRTNPDSRRHIVSAWNPADIDSMKLPPCHALFQFYTRELSYLQRVNIIRRMPGFHVLAATQPMDKVIEIMDGQSIPRRYLDCHLYQRSCDTFLGVPFNIASYAMLTHMIAQVVGMVPGEFIWTGGDVHLYLNHSDQVDLQLSREPRPLPKLHLNADVREIDDFVYEDFTLEGYDPHPAIDAPVSV